MKNADGRTPGALPLRAPTTQLGPLQPSDLSGQPSATKVPRMEAALTSSMEGKKDDSLSRFLPPAPSAECAKELQVSSHLRKSFFICVRA